MESKKMNAEEVLTSFFTTRTLTAQELEALSVEERAELATLAASVMGVDVDIEGLLAGADQPRIPPMEEVVREHDEDVV